MYSANDILITSLISLAVCAACVPFLSTQANRLGLIDKPGGRKQHDGCVPIVGGISVYLSVLLSGSIMGLNASFFLPLMVGLPIVISGLIDDRQSLTPLARIPIQVICALVMIYAGHIQIVSIGDVAGAGEVVLTGVIATVFTIICVVGVINSINMIDGVDGLSGSLIGLSLLPLALYAANSDDGASLALLASLVAALAAFLYYNSRLVRSRASVFLGDAGSTFLGFVLVWHLIKYTQGDQAVLSPISAGWILGLPLADTVVVILKRVLRGHSPMAADRNHIHHRLLDTGLTVPNTVIVMLSVHSVFIAIGMISNAYGGAEPLFFWGFVFVTVLHFFYTPRVLALLEFRGKRLAERQG